ncbi:MAG: flippase-like domain-containing protein [Saprospiraceae bacterium]|nr:flippase-like domain-containing protein [Saprospiraceae bacterium]
MKTTLGNLLRFTIYLSIGLGILYLVYDNQNEAYQAKCALDGRLPADCQLIDKIIQDFTQVHWQWIFVIMFLFLLSNLSRAVRWHMLLEPLGVKPRFINSFFAIMISYFANLGLSRVGELVRATTLARYENARTNQVMGTVVVDRMIDAVTMLMFIGVALLLDGGRIFGYLARNAQTDSIVSFLYSPYFWIASFVLLSLLVLAYRYRSRYSGHPLLGKIIDILRGFRDGMKTIAKLKKPGWFIAHSIFIWMMYYLMTWLCFPAYDPTAHLGPVAGLTTFVFGAFGIVIPAPGGMGTYQFLVSEALAIYNIPGDEGFSFSMIIFFSIQIFFTIFFGVLGIILLPLINKKKEDLPESEQDTSVTALS